MSTDPAIVPKPELERALAVTSQNVRSGAALVIASVVAPTVFVILQPFRADTMAIIVGGVVGTIFGGLKLAKALRARSAIRSKLGAQQLPVARLRS